MADESELQDKGRLLFGAGFVFGVMFTMSVLAVVIATVSSKSGSALLVSSVMVPIVASIVLTAVVGLGLSYLAFPENRTKIPVRFENDRSDDGTGLGENRE